jgi:peptidoglycan/LPS O-acetylase OafA/YrhL
MPMRPREKLDSLQALRGIAATAVVLNHAFSGASRGSVGWLNIPPRLVILGTAGVDIFFILSGFLMIYIAPPWFAGERGVGDFLVRRLVRVWPLYALTTLVKCVPLAIHAAWSGSLPFDLRPVRLAGLLFLPSYDVHGHVVPIVTAGWTLGYEMLFYACFSLVLLGAERRVATRLTAMLAVLFVLGRILKGTAFGDFLGQTIMVEFLMGVGIARIWMAGRLTGRFGGALIFAGLALLLANVAWPRLGMEIGGWRPLVYGIPMALVFAGFLAREGVAWPRPLLRLGDASYSIYLSNLPLIAAIRPPLEELWRSQGWVAPGLIPGALLVSWALLIGGICYSCIERPLLRVLSRPGFRDAARSDSIVPRGLALARLWSARWPLYSAIKAWRPSRRLWPVHLVRPAAEQSERRRASCRFRWGGSDGLLTL